MLPIKTIIIAHFLATHANIVPKPQNEKPEQEYYFDQPETMIQRVSLVQESIVIM